MPAEVRRKPHKKKTRPLGEVPPWSWIRFDGKLCWRIGKAALKDGKLVRISGKDKDGKDEIPDGKTTFTPEAYAAIEGKRIRVASVEYDELYELPVETEVSLSKVVIWDEEL